jgi:WD40 repeat protein
MKYFFLWMVALFLSGVIALSYIPQKMMANQDTVRLDSPVDSKTNSYIDLSIPQILPISDNSFHPQTSVPLSTERVANSPRGNGATQYQVTGDRSGKVTVKNTTSGEVIRTFQMDEGVVVRETFLLDDGKTVAASQKDHAVFWDLKTGKEIHRIPERIYGFSNDETKFFTYKLPQGIIFLHNYPSFTLVCKIWKGGDGPTQFRFSPNNRFLNIQFVTGYPGSDETYPYGYPTRLSLILAKLFEIQTCQEIKEFSQLRLGNIGEFSADSNFLYTPENIYVDINSQRTARTMWRFNLKTYQVEKLAD